MSNARVDDNNILRTSCVFSCTSILSHNVESLAEETKYIFQYCNTEGEVHDGTLLGALLKSWVDVQDESAKIEDDPRVKNHRWPDDTVAAQADRYGTTRNPQDNRSAYTIHQSSIAKLSALCAARGIDDRDAALATQVLPRWHPIRLILTVHR